MTLAYISKKLRERVAEQARYRCGYCLSSEQIVGLSMEVDHLIPQALGGATIEENLWLACSACNALKGHRVSALDPASGQMVRLFNPREQSWEEHFLWVDSGSRIVGRTAIGRATAKALRLNRPLLVRARWSWIKAGWHPPDD
ncbi:MAG TPA: HNH endonuclease signature motif containing protein [Thermoanaerobaculia bacterium]|nr:HNH endonuclease signature motif containing protein [Thermoanaerobaculia bacterium]